MLELSQFGHNQAVIKWLAQARSSKKRQKRSIGLRSDQYCGSQIPDTQRD